MAVITKSPYDTKEYRTLRLENGVVALLVSDTQPRRRSVAKRSSSVSSDESYNTATSGEEDSSEQSDEDMHVTDEEDHVTENQDHVTGDDEVEQTSSQSGLMWQSVCGVCVGAGSFADPGDVPGLAHLLEHMVFMGSEKYPGENTFDAFVSKHGGFDNASTDYERTVYNFFIQRQHFRKALDMFAQFFASPLLKPSSLAREIEAVDSEFQSSVQSDADRIQQLFCSMANCDHPFSKFVWGNSESLKKGPRRQGINLAERLQSFRQRHYSSHYLTVAVISADPLDVLEQWVNESFSAIPHNNLEKPSYSELPPPFKLETFHKLYKVVPVGDTHEVHVTWLLPPLVHCYRSKPLSYLGWLLGHEGEGSVLSLLKSRNLATDLSAGNGGEGYEYNSSFSLFSCSLTLTNDGFDRVYDCLTVVFQYLKLLQELGPQERVYEELRVIEENEFKFMEEMDPEDFVEQLCESMQLYPEQDYLTGNHLMFEYNPELISSMQSLLTPERANVMLISKRLAAECSSRERWFGTHYHCQELPSQWVESWNKLQLNSDLYLPAPNDFIATNFDLKEPDSPSTKYPVVIEECDKYKLWYRFDQTFKTPRGWICLLLKSSLHTLSAEKAALMDVLVSAWCLDVAELAYPAEVAELSYTVRVRTYGLALTLSGLNHKLPLLFETLVSHLATFTISAKTFAMAKEQVLRSYHNHLLKPRKYCKASRLQLLSERFWSELDKRPRLEEATHHSLQEFLAEFRGQLYVESLVQGNISAKEAKGLMEYFCRTWEFNPLPKPLQVPRVAQLPSNSVVRYQLANRDRDSPNTAIVEYYQCTFKTVRDQSISNLLVDVMQEPIFDQLRTKKQLGYEVDCMAHNTHGVLGISLNLITQASKCSSDYACQCMSEFVKAFHTQLLSYTPADFQAHVGSLIEAKLKPDVSLQEEVERNWSTILEQEPAFDQREKEVAELRTASQAEVGGWLQAFTQPGDRYRKLSVQVVSVDDVLGDAVDFAAAVPTSGCPSVISLTDHEGSVEQFKHSLSWCPVVAELRTASQAEVGGWLQAFTQPGDRYRKLSVQVVSMDDVLGDAVDFAAAVPTPGCPSVISLSEGSVEQFKHSLS